MSQGVARSYRIREFAKLTGVTPRALQHYDRMGLLSPERTQAGSRLYSDADLKALLQILALKSLGVPLRKIGALRASGPAALAETLGTQRQALERKKPAPDRVIFAVRTVEAALTRGEEADPAVLRPLMDALRNDRAQESPASEVERRPRHWADLKAEWQGLLDDVERTSGEPGDASFRDLALRWERLMALSTDGAALVRDLSHQAAVLRTAAAGSSRTVPGGALFDRIGPALANLVAPNGAGLPETR